MSLLKFIEVWIEAVRHIPALTITILPEILRALTSTLPFSLYISILMTLSYSVRRNIRGPAAILILFVISVGFNVAAGVGLEKAGTLPPAAPERTVSTLGHPGLMLNQGNITMILLEDPSKPDGSRVVSIPDQPLIYQEKPVGPGNSILPLPSAPFHEDLPYFLKSIILDFSLMAKYYQNLLGQGILQLIIYTAAVCLLLCSLRFLFTVSRWPLANLFLGALVFRGILTLETFLDTRETLDLIHSFLGNWMPLQYTGPLILTGMAVLVMLYSILAYFARGRKRDE